MYVAYIRVQTGHQGWKGDALAGQQAAVLGDEDIGDGAVGGPGLVGVAPRVQRGVPKRQQAVLLVHAAIRLQQRSQMTCFPLSHGVVCSTDACIHQVLELVT